MKEKTTHFYLSIPFGGLNLRYDYAHCVQELPDGDDCYGEGCVAGTGGDTGGAPPHQPPPAARGRSQAGHEAVFHHFQCSGSMTFWCGSGSADPCL
jgi:hypothetical protein